MRMSNRNLKVTATVKYHGGDGLEYEEVIFVVATMDDSLDETVQMALGGWCDIVTYTYENAPIVVTRKAIKGLVTDLIDSL
jgi:hypothetical protein